MASEDYDWVRSRLAVSYVSYEHPPPWLGGLGLPAPELTENGEPVGPLWYELTELSCTQFRPASGGYAPCSDLGHFYEGLMTPEASPMADLVRPDVLAAFTSTQRSGMYDPVLARDCDYGFGFMVNLRGHRFGDYCSAASYGHSGFQGTSLAMLDPDDGLVVALLYNDVWDWETAFLRRVGLVNAIYADLDIERPA